MPLSVARGGSTPQESSRPAKILLFSFHFLSGERLSAGFTLVGTPGSASGSARVPLDPLYAKRKNAPVTEKADEGVGRGPGGPPYQRKLPRTSGDFQSQSQPAGLSR
jgi:hypothetical protein